MSTDQVLKIESPRITRLVKPEKFNDKLAPLSIKKISIESSEFQAFFIFDERDRLIQVNLLGLEDENELINANSFNSLERLLTEKYGPPTFKLESEKVSWKLLKTAIELSHVNIPGVYTSLAVTYVPVELSKEASSDL